MNLQYETINFEVIENGLRVSDWGSQLNIVRDTFDRTKRNDYYYQR